MLATDEIANAAAKPRQRKSRSKSISAIGRTGTLGRRLICVLKSIAKTLYKMYY